MCAAAVVVVVVEAVLVVLVVVAPTAAGSSDVLNKADIDIAPPRREFWTREVFSKQA